jgi:hypothetical protein
MRLSMLGFGGYTEFHRGDTEFHGEVVLCGSLRHEEWRAGV